MAEEQGKKAMKTRYENRKASILKKGKELSTLCDVKVCVIVVSPDGKLETWPDNLNDVKAVLSAVKGSRKPIRSENLREKKGGGLGDSSRLCSRIKIPKSVKGKEIDCVFGNNGACVVDEVLYDVSGADQENNNARQQDNNFGIGILGMSLGVNQAPTSHYSCYQWNGNGNGESNCEKFGKYIGDMVRNQESSNLAAYYEQNESGSSSSAMNPKTHFCNMQPNPHHCYHQYEMGSSSTSAFNSGLNFLNQQQPIPLIAYHQQQYVIGNKSSTALNTTGLSNNMVHPTLAYQQYLTSALNSGANYPNQEPSSLAYQQYEFGIWE